MFNDSQKGNQLFSSEPNPPPLPPLRGLGFLIPPVAPPPKKKLALPKKGHKNILCMKYHPNKLTPLDLASAGNNGPINELAR